MTKPDVLDEAIAAHTQADHVKTVGGSRLDLILGELEQAGFDRVDDLVGLLVQPTTALGHQSALGIIRTVCEEYDVSLRGLNCQNVTQWRTRNRAER